MSAQTISEQSVPSPRIPTDLCHTDPAMAAVVGSLVCVGIPVSEMRVDLASRIVSVPFGGTLRPARRAVSHLRRCNVVRGTVDVDTRDRVRVWSGCTASGVKVEVTSRHLVPFAVAVAADLLAHTVAPTDGEAY